VSPDRSTDYFASLVRDLRTLPRETEWVEFKVNNSNPIEIGEYISALANAAALLDKPRPTSYGVSRMARGTWLALPLSPRQ
jgi:hypothetical protein